jgi:hypothetical protein
MRNFYVTDVQLYIRLNCYELFLLFDGLEFGLLINLVGVRVLLGWVSFIVSPFLVIFYYDMYEGL